MSIAKKMWTIGFVAVVGLLVLLGNSWRSNNSVKAALETSDERNDQLATVNKMSEAQLEMVLAAMDSILDKDEGKITDERMQTINESAKFLNETVEHLVELADTDAEKREAAGIEKNLTPLTEFIRVKLSKLIEENGTIAEQSRAAFEETDDVLDEYGEAVGDSLDKLEHSFQTKLTAGGNVDKASSLTASVRLHLVQVQQWLTDISATRGAEGYDDGFDEAEKHANAFRADLEELVALMPRFKKTADPLLGSFEEFYEKGKWMATQYIKGGPELGNEAMAEFDKYAEDIGASLEPFLKEMQDAQAHAKALRQGVDVANYAGKAHLRLMLAAMDSIIDKDEGNINDERMADISGALADLDRYLKELDTLANSAEDKGFVSSAREGLTHLDKGIRIDLKTLIEESTQQALAAEAAFEEMDDVVDEYAEAVAAGLHSIQTSVAEEQEEAAEDLNSTLATAKVTTIAVSLGTIVVLSVILVVIARSIVGPIKRIIRGLNEGADQVNDASGQVSSASQQLAEGASEQASSLEETSSALEQMAAMTRTNAENAKQANELGGQARVAAENGAKIMTRLSEAMTAIGDSSGEIGKINKAIEEIAFQTNLLALNAAVEAARAGEHGKGFAVVADEVRNLAQRAAQASKDAAALIDNSVEKAKQGTDIASEVANALGAIVGDVTKVTDLMNGITQASNEQAQGVDQVNTAVSQMDKVTQQNASGAEESASAAEQLAAQASAVKGTVDELAAVVSGSQSNGMVMSGTHGVPTGQTLRRLDMNVAHVAKRIDKKPLRKPVAAAGPSTHDEGSKQEFMDLQDANMKDF